MEEKTLEEIAIEKDGKKYIELYEGCDTGFMYIVVGDKKVDKAVLKNFEEMLNRWVDGFGWGTLLKQNKLIRLENDGGRYLLELETAKAKINKVFELEEEKRKKELKEKWGKLLELKALTEEEKKVLEQKIMNYKELKQKYVKERNTIKDIDVDKLDVLENEKAIKVTYNFYSKYKDKIKAYALWDAERKIWKFRNEQKFEEIKQIIQQLKEQQKEIAQLYEQLQKLETEISLEFSKRAIVRSLILKDSEYEDEGYWKGMTYWYFKFKEDAELYKEFEGEKVEEIEILGEKFFRVK